MALSPNYGWSEPDNSSLVKNGAADIRTLGDAIDTSLWNVGFGQAGKNKIINGDFAINQRNFTSVTSLGYGFDRFLYAPSGATANYSPQTFTLGAAPVAGYENRNFARLAVTTGNDFARLTQLIESVRTFAGQTATLSFWAKGTNPTTAGNLKASLSQVFGTGGSPSATVDLAEQTFVLTANWTRYSFTFSVPSISGKTIGTDNNDYLAVNLGQGSSTSAEAWTLDTWGWQLEYGSKATPFETATGTIQGELAACQRYYFRSFPELTSSIYGMGLASSTTQTEIVVNLPVTMRTSPASIDTASIQVSDGVTGYSSGTFILSSTRKTPNVGLIIYQHGSAALTQYRPYRLENASTTAGYIGFSAEL